MQPRKGAPAAVDCAGKVWERSRQGRLAECQTDSHAAVKRGLELLNRQPQISPQQAQRVNAVLTVGPELCLIGNFGGPSCLLREIP